MNIAVTGPSTITSVEASKLRKDMLDNFTPDDHVFSGCADGVDSIAIAAAIEAGAHLHLVIPAAHHNERIVDDVLGYERIYLHYAPRGETDASSFMLRNDELAKRADVLLAYPRKTTFYRSGEWATINRAHKADKRVDVRPTLLSPSSQRRRK